MVIAVKSNFAGEGELAYQFLSRFFIVNLHIFAADFSTLRAVSLKRDLRYALDA